MKEFIKKLRRKILYNYRADARKYARRLNQMGARIDENIHMSVPESVRLDETTPYMLEIGENVWLAEGVSILTHDASWLILMRGMEKSGGISARSGLEITFLSVSKVQFYVM